MASHFKRAELAALATILLLAAWLRMGWPGLTEFKADEARLTALALDFVEGKTFPVRGIGSSVGLPNAPLSVYLYALPLLLWRSPLSATLFTGGINVLAVALGWWLGRRYWGTAAALCAALLFATGPWAVLYSRKIWAQDLLPPFALAYAATALLAFVEQRRWALAAHLALLAMVMQIHYSGLALMPLTALWLIIFRKRLDWRIGLAGVAAALVISSPFAYYLWQHRSGGFQPIVDWLAEPATLDWQSLRFWWMTATGSDIHSLAGSPGYARFLQSVPNLDPVRWATGALVVLGLGIGIGAPAAGRRRTDQPGSVAEAGGIVATWALAPLIFFWRHSTPVFPHYFIVSLPAQFLAAAIAINWVISSRRRWMRLGTFGVVLAIALAQGGIFVALLRFVGSQTTPGGFGLPLQYQLQASTRARASGLPIVVASPGDDPVASEWPAVFDVWLRGVAHRFVDGARLAAWPGEPASLLITPGAGTAAQVYEAAEAIGPQRRLANRLGDEPFYVSTLSENGALPLAQALLSPAAEPRRLANGVEIVGYRLIGDRIIPGRSAEWWVAWRVLEPPPDLAADYHIFNHLVDAGGRRWSQADSATVPAKDWAAGDLVVQVFRLEVDQAAGPGPYWIRVGMYTYPGLQNQPVLDAVGNPVTDAVVVELATGR